MDALAGARGGFTPNSREVFSEEIMTKKLTIAELHKLYASGATKPSEVCREALDRIERDNERLNAYITINRKSAMKLADAMDADIQNSVKQRPLAGVPVAVKDNMCMAGVRTTCGSRILSDYLPPYTA